MRTEEFTVNTRDRYDVVDITDRIEELVGDVEQGLCVVTLPHATAGLIVNEYEPNIAKDYIALFRNILPKLDYAHNRIDDNAEAHLLSSMFGSSKVFLVKNGRLVLGTWQRVILCEFDGPRTRRVVVGVKE